MSVLIFKLKDAPLDEVQDIRDLLTENNMEFHETTGGLLGISVAGIWLLDPSQKESARTLIEAYEYERSLRIKSEYEQLKRQGEHETLKLRFFKNPLRVFLYIAIAIGFFYAVVSPFIKWKS